MRLIEEARLIGVWGHLLQAGVDEGAALGVLADETPDGALLAFARAAREGLSRLPAVMDEHGEALSSWTVALLSVTPRRGEHLVAAAALLEREAARWGRALVWARLALMHDALVPPGEALGALARDAREHDQARLGEALYAAAKRGRAGASLLEALRSAAPGLAASERLILDAARADAVPRALRALEGVSALVRAHAGPAMESGPSLSGIAQAATAGAAPLRRGLDRLLTGIEEALGIGDGRPEPGRADLAREALAARAERGSPTQERVPPGSGERAAAAGAQKSAPEPASGKTVGPDAPAAARPGGKKTFGLDSGPTPIPGFEPGATSVDGTNREA